MWELIVHLTLMLAGSLVVWQGGRMLEATSERLAKHYRLSPVVQGSLVTAIGSSFPELSTTVLSTLLHGAFDLGVAAIVGSAIFNILVIPALSSIAAGHMHSEWKLVVKDMQFYLISIIALLLVFSLSVIYNPVEGAVPIQGTVTWSLALFPLLLYLLYLYFQQQDNKAYRQEQAQTTTVRDQQIGQVWLRFGISLVLILASVEALVQGALFLGDYFQTPSFVWGATVLAAATSVPDAVVSARGALHGNGITSLANVIGSNIFDLLIAVPVGILIAGQAVVNFSVATPMMLFLGGATLILILLLTGNRVLNRWKGILLLLVYLIFVVWLILESTGLTSFMGQLPSS